MVNRAEKHIKNGDYFQLAVKGKYMGTYTEQQNSKSKKLIISLVAIAHILFWCLSALALLSIGSGPAPL